MDSQEQPQTSQYLLPAAAFEEYPAHAGPHGWLSTPSYTRGPEKTQLADISTHSDFDTQSVDAYHEEPSQAPPPWLPEALLAQYPALAGIQWDTLPPSNLAQTDDDILGLDSRNYAFSRLASVGDATRARGLDTVPYQQVGHATEGFQEYSAHVPEAQLPPPSPSDNSLLTQNHGTWASGALYQSNNGQVCYGNW